jgi:hypothetical protein
MMTDEEMAAAGWDVKRKQIERLTIVCPRNEAQGCLMWLSENGYTCTRSGPYTDRDMYPRADISRSLFIAEREVESPES